MPSDPQKTMFDQVREQLSQTNQTDLEIFKATGLSPYWLSKVRTGVIQDPSVNRVQILFDHFNSD